MHLVDRMKIFDSSPAATMHFSFLKGAMSVSELKQIVLYFEEMNDPHGHREDIVEIYFFSHLLRQHKSVT